MIRLIRVEMLKARTTRLWFALLIPALLLVGAVTALTIAASGTEEGRRQGIDQLTTAADLRELISIGGVVTAFTLVLGATSITVEHRHKTLSGTFLVTPERWRIVMAKIAANALVGFAFGVVGGLVPLVMAAIWLPARGDALPLDASVVLAVLVVGVIGAYSAAVGAGVGAMLRSQVVAILSTLGWMLVVEPLVGGLLPDVLRWLPFAGAMASIGPDTPNVFGPAAGVALMIGYVAVAGAIGIAVTERRDVA